ncbi:MAG: ArnT family glycosyltransferase [Candidatus Hydrogenedentales bacterium]
MAQQHSTRSELNTKTETSVQRHWLLAGLVCLIALHICANLWWLHVDNHPIRADEARHLLSARTHYEILSDTEKSFKERCVGIFGVADIYPPLTHIAGALMMRFVGTDTDSATLVMVLAHASIIVAIWFLARSLWAPTQAFAATVVVSLLPLYCSASRYFSTDYLESAFVIWALVALTRSDGFRNARWSFLFALCAGLGMLSRQTALVQCFGSAAATFIWGIYREFTSKEDKKNFRIARLFTTAGIVILLCVVIPALWYYPHYATMQGFWQKRFDKPAGFHPKGLWLAHFLGLIQGGLFLPPFLLALVGFAMALRKIRHNWTYGVVVSYVVSFYVICTWGIHAYLARYLIAFSVICGMFICIPLFAIKRQIVRRVCTATLLVFQVFQYGNLTFGPYPLGSSLVLPVAADYPLMKRLRYTGLSVYNDHIIGGAYSFYPPYRGPNWKDRLFQQMTQHELHKHYVTGRRALYQLVDIGGLAMELDQARYWPRKSPFIDDGDLKPDAQSPLVSLITKQPSPQAHLHFSSGKQSGSCAFNPGDRLEVSFEAGAQIDIVLESPQEMSALAFEFTSATMSPEIFTVRFDALEHDKTSVSEPGIRYVGPKQSFHLFQFPSRVISQIQVSIPSQEQNKGPLSLAGVNFFARIPQPRPLHFYGGPAVNQNFLEHLKIAHYVIFRRESGSRSPYSAQYAQMREVVDQDFEMLDMFHEPASGILRACTYSLYARKQAQPLTYWTNPQFSVRVSGSVPDQGRWDIPWWQFPDYAPAPSGYKSFWASSAPAIVDANLGGLHNVSAIELTPLSAKDGFSVVKAFYWDRALGLWERLPDAALTVSPPRASNEYFNRKPPEPWDSPILTDRIQLVFEKGAEDNPQLIVLATAHIYGNSAEENLKDEGISQDDAADALFSLDALPLADFLSERGAEEDFLAKLRPTPGDEGAPMVVAFDACSWGDGVLDLKWGHETILRIPSAPPEIGFWNAGDIAVACQSLPGQREASYRIVLSGKLATESRQSQLQKLGFHLQGNIKGSHFRILNDAE